MPSRTRRLVTSLVATALVATVGLVVVPSASAATKPTIYASTPAYAISTSTVRFSGTVYPAAGQKVRVQRKSGTKWVSIDTATVSASTGKFSVAYHVPAGKKSYRIVVLKTSKTSTAVKTWSTWTTDGKKYKTYIARARSYMKAYCPTTPIFIGDDLVNSYTVGMATERYSYTSYGGSSERHFTWQHQIHLEPGLSKPLLRHVALHECAHIVQFRRLVKGPEARAKAEKTTATVFKKRAGEYGDGNERQADCMAIVITKQKQYGGYTQSCTGARATSAKALWKAYGKKYQAPVYRFTVK
ncbi:MAG: hypothetical protein AAGC49_15470 [Brevundimonas sp.]